MSKEFTAKINRCIHDICVHLVDGELPNATLDIIKGKVNTILTGYLENEDILAYEIQNVKYCGKYAVEINYTYKSDFVHSYYEVYRLGQDMIEDGVGFEL